MRMPNGGLIGREKENEYIVDRTWRRHFAGICQLKRMYYVYVVCTHEAKTEKQYIKRQALH
jgi:hypothetical protein